MKNKPIGIFDSGIGGLTVVKNIMKLLPHAHTGMEMTCVLAGSFSHDGARYGAGDFDLGDPDVDHEISIGAEEECIAVGS